VHQNTNPQEFVHIAGREQLPVASVVRDGGRQFAGTDGERGKRAVGELFDRILTSLAYPSRVHYFTDLTSRIAFSVLLQIVARAGPVLSGGDVFLDVLRGAVLAHAAGGHVPHRDQSDAVSTHDRLGHTGVVGVHLRDTPGRHSRRNVTVSTFVLR